MNTNMIVSLAKLTFSFAGGVLMSIGVASSADVAALSSSLSTISGAVMTVAPVVYSIYQHWPRKPVA
jgi:hypothetical protein